MAPRQSIRQTATRREAARPQSLFWAQALENAALFGLLLIIAMRPLIAETYDSALTQIDRATGDVGSLTPATTAWFDLGILLCGLAAVAGKLVARERWHWTRLEIGWLLLLGGAIISTAAAANRRLALNASADWLITALIIFVLSNLCRTRWRAALVLTVIIASGVTSLARSTMQITTELPDTRRHYFETREEFWARQGVPLDDPRVELFERRMRGTAASGFFPHSNVQAALFVLCGFAGLGLAGLVWQRQAARVSGIVPGLVLLAATVMTASKGGVLSAVIGLGMAAAAWALLPRWLPHWRKLLVIGWVAVVIAGCGVLLYGIARGGLPGASLQFRWEYWKVTSRIIADRPWTGEGALNFDHAYLLHKPIEYPEEIKDPHNFLLSIVAQWGVLGGLGLVWMMLAGSYRALRLMAASASEAADPPPDRQVAIRWSIVLIGGFVVLRLLLMRAYWMNADSTASALVVFDLGFYGLIWAAMLAGLIWLLTPPAPAAPAARASASASKVAEARLEGHDLMRIALLSGVEAFLLHNLVEFAILYPGTLTPFAAMTGVLLGRPKREPAPGGTAAGEGTAAVRSTRGGAAFLLVAGTLLLVALLWLVHWPVTRANRLLTAARRAVSPESAERFYKEAVHADPLDSTAPAELAGLYAQYRGAYYALETVRIALQRSPMDADLYALQALAHDMRYQETGDPKELHAAIAATRMGVQLYPASPDKHLALGDTLARAARELGDANLAGQAIRAYQRALELDAARPGIDEVRRWSPQRREDVHARMKAVQDLGPAATTSSTSPAP